MAAEKSESTFYVTTPIYYVNDVPHIGHAYTTIIADACTRWKRQTGSEAFFLTGTDEHGQKIEKSAAARGIRPIELADQVVGRFKDLWKALDIECDFFIRTTQPSHEKGVQELFRRLLEKGDIYKGVYKGWYCVSDENFLSEDVALEEDGSKICPDCGKRALPVEEDTYFFRLSAYGDRLLEHYRTHPRFVRPQSRMNEITSFVRQGLKDLSITRTTVKWGIPVPGDPEHTVYVWFDALHNYLTGIGFNTDQALYDKFWPADLQLIGKDILRFHAVFWPAFLMAGGFELPGTVFAHGWWLMDKTKMSKSRGNVLDPHILLDVFGSDAVRYFLLREIPIGLDGNFSHEGFIHRVNSDLANDLGNLVQRTLTMIFRYFEGVFPEMEEESPGDRELREGFPGFIARTAELYDDFSINRALEEIWIEINRVNKYLADNEPWKLAKDPALRGRLARVLFQAAAAVRGIAWLIYPVMPRSADRIWADLGEADGPAKVKRADLAFEGFTPDRTLRAPEPLFPRVDAREFFKDDETERKPGPPAPKAPAKPKASAPEEKKMDIITFDEFKKLDLRVGRIVSAERVEGTRKLIKIQIDLGEDTPRQMISGIADTYKAEDLVGRKMIVVANLKPAKIRGIESQAMLLAAIREDGGAVIPFFSEEIPAGAPVQ